MADENVYMTINEFAKQSRSHRNTVNKWIKTGVIESVKIGQKRLIPTSEIYKLGKEEKA